MKEFIKLNFTPGFVVGYFKNLRAHAKKEKHEKAEIAMLDDAVTMLEIAAAMFKPEPEAEPDGQNDKVTNGQNPKS